LLKLRLFRPFPRRELLRLVKGKKRLIVLNRAVSYGVGGTVSQEIRAALFQEENRPTVHDVIVSLGGKEVFPEMIEQIARRAGELSPMESIWI